MSTIRTADGEEQETDNGAGGRVRAEAPFGVGLAAGASERAASASRAAATRAATRRDPVTARGHRRPTVATRSR